MQGLAPADVDGVEDGEDLRQGLHHAEQERRSGEKPLLFFSSIYFSRGNALSKSHGWTPESLYKEGGRIAVSRIASHGLDLTPPPPLAPFFLRRLAFLVWMMTNIYTYNASTLWPGARLTSSKF